MIPLENIVADLQFEMIGRPDAGVHPSTLWLTGFERSTLGPELAKRGARLEGDPHPSEQFFVRSDNYSLALRGVVAHTMSSYGLHKQYHEPSDEIQHLNLVYMEHTITSLVAPLRWFADTTWKPVWREG